MYTIYAFHLKADKKIVHAMVLLNHLVIDYDELKFCRTQGKGPQDYILVFNILLEKSLCRLDNIIVLPICIAQKACCYLKQTKKLSHQVALVEVILT